MERRRGFGGCIILALVPELLAVSPVDVRVSFPTLRLSPVLISLVKFVLLCWTSVLSFLFLTLVLDSPWRIFNFNWLWAFDANCTVSLAELAGFTLLEFTTLVALNRSEGAGLFGCFELAFLVLSNELTELLELFGALAGLLVVLNIWLGDFSFIARILRLGLDTVKLGAPFVEGGPVGLLVFNLPFGTFSSFTDLVAVTLLGFLTGGFSFTTINPLLVGFT